MTHSIHPKWRAKLMLAPAQNPTIKPGQILPQKARRSGRITALPFPA